LVKTIARATQSLELCHCRCDCGIGNQGAYPNMESTTTKRTHDDTHPTIYMYCEMMIQLAYFRLSRNLINDDVKRTHQDGVERLREAREFAEWSRKDREARLPKLTDEQRQQMQQYLQIVGQHGLSKTFSDAAAKDCINCPIMVPLRKAASVEAP